jgi:DNA-binding MarR family transcriptional regulator
MTTRTTSPPRRNVGRPASPAAALDRLLSTTALLFFRMRAASRQMIGQGAQSTARRSMLRELRQHGPRTVAEMARARPVSRQFFQRVADALAQEGMVRFAVNPQHKRSQLVVVSAKGLKYLAALETRESAVLAKLAEGFSVEDLMAATTVSAELIARLDALAPVRQESARGLN